MHAAWMATKLRRHGGVKETKAFRREVSKVLQVNDRNNRNSYTFYVETYTSGNYAVGLCHAGGKTNPGLLTCLANFNHRVLPVSCEELSLYPLPQAQPIQLVTVALTRPFFCEMDLPNIRTQLRFRFHFNELSSFIFFKAGSPWIS